MTRRELVSGADIQGDYALLFVLQHHLQLGWGNCLQFWHVRKRSSASTIDFGILQKIVGTRRQVAGQLVYELFAALDLQSVVGETLSTDRRGSLGSHVAAAERTGAVGWIHEDFVRQFQKLVVQAVIKQAGQFLRCVGSGEIGTAYISEKKRITGQYGPRLERLDRFLVMGDQQAYALQRVSRSFQNFDPGL